MKVLLVVITAIIITLVRLTFLHVEEHPECLKSVEQSGAVERFYKIDELRFEIEMLEIDRQYKIRPEEDIQKELDIANTQLKRLLK